MMSASVGRNFCGPLFALSCLSVVAERHRVPLSELSLLLLLRWVLVRINSGERDGRRNFQPQFVHIFFRVPERRTNKRKHRTPTKPHTPTSMVHFLFCYLSLARSLYQCIISNHQKSHAQPFKRSNLMFVGLQIVDVAATALTGVM